ncbi:MAG: hypothetical protein AAFP81_01055 [Pseudomonadota bacterium]
MDKNKIAQWLYTGWVVEHGFPNGLPTYDELPDESPIKHAADSLCKQTWLGIAEFIQEALQAEKRTDKSELEELRADKARLDFLDEANHRLNEQAGSKYGWEIIFNHNVNRLMIANSRLAVDLNDARAYGYKSCRDAIDVKMKDIEVRRARDAKLEGEGSDG